MIRTAQFDMADEKEKARYESALNDPAVEILQEKIEFSEGYFYIFLKYKA